MARSRITTNATPPSPDSGKPEVAARESATFVEYDPLALQGCYNDAARAIAFAASIRRIDENAHLRAMLAGLLATAFQHLRNDLDDGALNTQANNASTQAASVFRLQNVSREQNRRAIRVHLISSLFPRQGFPFDIGFEDNLNVEIERKLPS